MDEEKLIEYVRENDHLYNPANKDYRNQHIRSESWNEIGNKLGVSGIECKDTWTKIRNAYTNAQKRRKTKSGHEAKNIVKWKFEDQMSFLQPTVQPKKTQGNFSLQTDYEDQQHLQENLEENDGNLPSDAELTSPIENSANSQHSTSIETSHPAIMPTNAILNNTPSANRVGKHKSRGTKRRLVENSINEIVQIMKDSSRIRSKLLFNNSSNSNQDITSAHNETEMLFLSLGRTVTKLNPIEQASIKLEVSNIVFQAELRQLQRHSNQPAVPDSAITGPPVAASYSSDSSPLSCVDSDFDKRENSNPCNFLNV